MNYNNFIENQRNNINKKANSNGKCKICNKRNINYNIENGNFIYFCISCNKIIAKDQVLI